MSTTEIPESINRRRRSLLGTAALSLAATHAFLVRSVDAQSDMIRLPAIAPGTNKSFASLKQIDAGLLNVGYAEAGPANGSPVILLHGWPYDIYSYVDVAPLLAAAGRRVIVPYLRGYGPTRFLSADTFRNGQPSVFALDIIALMDALDIQEAVFGGFDWGTRTADIIATLSGQFLLDRLNQHSDMLCRLRNLLGTRLLLPDLEGLGPNCAISICVQKVPAGMEVAMDKCVSGEEVLGLSR